MHNGTFGFDPAFNVQQGGANPHFNPHQGLPDPNGLIGLNGEYLGVPNLSREEELRRMEAPREIAYKGNIVKIYSLKEGKQYTDYLILETDLGVKQPVHRVDALQRAHAILGMLLRDTGGADPLQMEKDIWLCHEVFKQAIANGRANGKQYKSQAIKRFEEQIRDVERNWKNIQDEVRTTKTVVRGFPGVPSSGQSKETQQADSVD